MSALRIITLAIIAGGLALSTSARHKPYTSVAGYGRTAGSSGVAAGCAPPAASIILDLNNVRTTIQSGGDMWWDLENARYEVPKGSGKHSIFSGSLWMGGVDVNNQLKVAALAFRNQGFDFWPGPLDLANAEIDAATCSAYDKFFPITRTQVNQFVAWYLCGQDPDCSQAEEYPGYSIPAEILDWPAHGDVSVGQDYFLAPYFDQDGSGDYNPEDGGDYPYYDLTANPDCNSEREVKLFGDETLWWVFNDKGNIHTETNASPIGMEIRAQGFAFATNDEINDMTFYNYELINRGSFTLTNTFFAPWVDPDLGDAEDDYVGCDVRRGLGYCYNGDAFDGVNGGGPTDYPDNPPAVGLDFFQGPYQDNDNIDNPLYSDLSTCDVALAFDEGGIVYPGIGIGYGDGIADNERFGMRKFVYFTRADLAPNYGNDPDDASDYYNYMNGIWKDDQQFCYGGTGHPAGGCDANTLANYMFPGDSDPCGWGTGGVAQPAWTEQSANNPIGDRRFLQSAGPFTLLPGAVNDITVGVVWAWDAGGSNPFDSVEKLRKADDKAQALFDNCFVLIDGPDAPELEVIELDRELVLVISNPTISNNANEDYAAPDPFIVCDTVPCDNVFRFEGYQIFQLRNSTVSSSDLTNPDLARLVAQCDVKNFRENGEPIDQLVNFTFSEELNANLPIEMVNGENDGISHTFQLQNDEFATGDRRLVNHKKYYYMAVAYAYNEYQPYDQNNPLLINGQKTPYLSGRKTANGSAISPVIGIPHIEGPEQEGTIINAQYGDGPEITRVEGRGNGGRDVRLLGSSIRDIMSSPDNRAELVTYESGFGPIDVKVYNPFKVPNAEFQFKILDSITPGNLTDAYWVLDCISGDCPTNTNGETIDHWESKFRLGEDNISEQLIEEVGLSISITQTIEPGEQPEDGNGYITSTIDYSSAPFWLAGIQDQDGTNAQNWIRSGTVDGVDFPGVDDAQIYESLLNGTVAPYRLVAQNDSANGAPGWEKFRSLASLDKLSGVDVYITSNKDNWTRCPVIEVADDSRVPTVGDAEHMNLRMSPSVNKEGQVDDSQYPFGMGWFPGYAINVETGERLNMAFGESSWLRDHNGADMIWNPTQDIFGETFDPAAGWFNAIMGGMHYVYIFGHNEEDAGDGVPAYDGGAFIYDKLSQNNFSPTDPDKRRVYQDCMWVLAPLVAPNTEFMSSAVDIKLRVQEPYMKDFAPGWSTTAPENDNLPMYTFSTGDLAVTRGDLATAEEALNDINIVPNPYYGSSGYETNQLENIVKIINLPDVCSVNIYTVNGTLVRNFEKASPLTSVEWDMKNHAGIPVGSGLYLVHINAPGIGERVLKWFGSVRQLDLDSF